jgi:predicted nucleotidyltransferase
MNTFFTSLLSFRILQQLITARYSYTHQLAKSLAISPPHINRICNQLKKQGILRARYENNRKLYELNYRSLLTQTLLRLLTVMNMKQSKNFRKLKSIAPFGIYGSFAEGKQQKESDLDIWVYASRSEEKAIRIVLNDIEKEWGHAVNVIYLDENRMRDLRSKDPEFYLRLRIQSITEWGEIFERT